MMGFRLSKTAKESSPGYHQSKGGFLRGPTSAVLQEISSLFVTIQAAVTQYLGVSHWSIEAPQSRIWRSFASDDKSTWYDL